MGAATDSSLRCPATLWTDASRRTRARPAAESAFIYIPVQRPMFVFYLRQVEFYPFLVYFYGLRVLVCQRTRTHLVDFSSGSFRNSESRIARRRCMVSVSTTKPSHDMNGQRLVFTVFPFSGLVHAARYLFSLSFP